MRVVITLTVAGQAVGTLFILVERGVGTGSAFLFIGRSFLECVSGSTAAASVVVSHDYKIFRLMSMLNLHMLFPLLKFKQVETA